MRVRHCSKLFFIIPDALGYTLRVARVPQDWSLSGYVARTIARIPRFRRVSVASLACGDVLSPTGTVILSRPMRGLSTPPGKAELWVRRRNGREQIVTWNLRTVVTVKVS